MIKTSCTTCLLRQPTLESASNFDPDDDLHWECALGNEMSDDNCTDYILDYT